MPDHRELEAARLSTELTKAFSDGSVFLASDNDLDRYLKHLCSESVPNETVRHRAMNRCQVINTIKNFRFIKSIEKTNKLFTLIVIILTIVNAYIGYLSVGQSKDATRQIEKLIYSNEKRQDVIVNSLVEYVKNQSMAIQLLTDQNSALTEELKNLSGLSRDISEELKSKNASNKAN